ncbi:hypothetical protein YC2023_078279 [Brassica napus]
MKIRRGRQTRWRFGFLNPVSAGFVALDEISMLIDESSPKKRARPWKMHVNQGDSGETPLGFGGGKGVGLCPFGLWL